MGTAKNQKSKSEKVLYTASWKLLFLRYEKAHTWLCISRLCALVFALLKKKYHVPRAFENILWSSCVLCSVLLHYPILIRCFLQIFFRLKIQFSSSLLLLSFQSRLFRSCFLAFFVFTSLVQDNWKTPKFSFCFHFIYLLSSPYLNSERTFSYIYFHFSTINHLVHVPPVLVYRALNTCIYSTVWAAAIYLLIYLFEPWQYCFTAGQCTKRSKYHVW